MHAFSMCPPRYGAAVRRIVSSEGGWANMYKGLRPTLLGVVPYAGLSFMTFESISSLLQCFKKQQNLHRSKVAQATVRTGQPTA